jgi:hypothetical protein
MSAKNKYVVIANTANHSQEWGKSLQESMGICHTCAKAYEIAIFLAGITKPNQNYRKILSIINRDGAATLSQLEGTQAATIVKVKLYGK